MSAANAIRSGTQSIVISSIAARPSMPVRRDTSPVTSSAVNSSPSAAASEYSPAAGARRRSGSAALTSSSLTYFDRAFTVVTTFCGPGAIVRPVNSSASWSPEVTTTLYVFAPPLPFAPSPDSSDSSTATGSSASARAITRSDSPPSAPAAGSAAWRAPSGSPPTRTTQHMLPPLSKNPATE